MYIERNNLKRKLDKIDLFEWSERIESERERERETDRQTDRQIDSFKERDRTCLKR